LDILFWTLVGFLLGAIPFSLLMGKLFAKKDIRTIGDGNPGGTNAISVVLSIVLWMIAYRRFKFPAYLVFYYPLSLALFIAVVIRSFFQTATGTAMWKDRLLDRVAMRWL